MSRAPNIEDKKKFRSDDSRKETPLHNAHVIPDFSCNAQNPRAHLMPKESTSHVERVCFLQCYESGLFAHGKAGTSTLRIKCVCFSPQYVSCILFIFEDKNREQLASIIFDCCIKLAKRLHTTCKTNEIQNYNPFTNTWSEKQPLPPQDTLWSSTSKRDDTTSPYRRNTAIQT